MSSNATTTVDSTATRLREGFRFFFGEFAERCSYYGMQAILPLYLTHVCMPDDQSQQQVVLLVQDGLLLPSSARWVAAGTWKYWTIVGFSVQRTVIAQLLIGIENDWSSCSLWPLCAMGSGVIKPNISA